MAIITQIFDNNSWSQFLASATKTFQSETRQSNCQAGVYVLLKNQETKEIVGLAKLGTFPEGETLRERFLLNEDQYKGQSAVFNLRYEIAVEKVITFKPISYDDFAFLFDIDNKVRWNNITKNSNLQNCLSYKPEKEEDKVKVIKKLVIWAKSLLEAK